jgi:V/A-type H+/Na+-transporting ATPase subunit I
VIARMKRISLVLFEKEKEQGLIALRRLGVVHLQPMTGRGPRHEQDARQLGEVQRALALLSTRKAPKGAARAEPEAAAGGDAIKTARGLNALSDEARLLQDERLTLVKELERLAGLGDFEPEDVRALASAGIALRLFECPVARLKNMPGEAAYIPLPSTKTMARVALLGAQGPELPAEFAEISLPALSPAGIRERVKGIEARAGEIDASITASRAALPVLTAARARLEQDLLFETVSSGMESEGPVAFLTGYVPAKDLPGLQAEARSRAWALLAVDPAPEELPPSKVENPGIIRIVEPLFAFLGTVPNYREYDISGWFLLFFSLFFAMIFGDGGYGLIMLVISVVALIKTRKAGKPVPPFLKLLFLLTATTIAWGAATCSWFATAPEALPSFLRAVAIPAIMNGNPEAGTNIKIFCFIIGSIQLSLAHLKNIRRDFPSPKFLAQVGSLSLVIGMFMAVLNLVVDSARFPIPVWAIGAIGGGFFLVLMFGSWTGNILTSLLEGLKGIIPTFLGTVSVFADVVSYIRLWAVGLAGVAISQTINGMVSGMLGDPAGRVLAFAIGALMGVVLLLVGHGLNIAMSVLSVLVHGVRLNMLEFSGHLGMEWSGYSYDPFRETVRDGSSTRRETP